jgi:ML domain
MINTLFSKAVLGLSALFLNATVNDCSSGTSVFKLNEVDIKPVNPVPGQDVALHIDYTVPEGVTVTDGTAEYDITYNFIPFEPTVEPLCQNVPCPLEAGTYSNTSISQWPSSLSGLLVTQMKWLDSNKNLLLCVEIDSQLVEPPVNSTALVLREN